MKTKVIVLFLIVSNSVYAQDLGGVNREFIRMTAIDDCLLTMDYLYTFHKDTLGNPPFSEKYRLDVGQKYSRYYSLYGENIILP